MTLTDIIVKGARTHNLKNIDLRIPKNTLAVFTGLSGSGKSSLAFDTIFAEGQRRYVESMSTYARQFLDLLEKPDVDEISGLSPAVSIDQKTAPRNPRSTVGTVTEIYDYLRLLYAKVGTPYSPITGKPLERQSASEIIDIIADLPEGKKIMLVAPIVKGKKGTQQRVFEKIKQDGFVRLRVNGETVNITDLPELDANKHHNIDVVVDRLVVKNFHRQKKTLNSGQEIDLPNPDRSRLADSVELCMKLGEGVMYVVDFETGEEQVFSEHFAEAETGFSIAEIEPRSFSFNSPHGACPDCHGLGTKLSVDLASIVPNSDLTLAEGALSPWASTPQQLEWFTTVLTEVGKVHGFNIDTPFKKLTEKQVNIIFYGTEDDKYQVVSSMSGSDRPINAKYEGVVPNIERLYHETESEFTKRRLIEFMEEATCQTCKGARLRVEILNVKIGDKSIIDATSLSVEEGIKFFSNLTFSKSKTIISEKIIKEILARLQFLADVGLRYLTLDRRANTLSGGEAQRIRLATQIGSKLSGVIYVLDEPSIGLHQNDNDKLIKTLLTLRDLGNTVIVVEHDIDTMLHADYIVDIGPGAGKHGGEVIAVGTPQELMDNPESATGQFLAGKRSIATPETRRPGNGKFIKIIGATENNLQNLTVEFPLGTFIGVSGVSGSGKSTLINEILVKAVESNVNSRSRSKPGSHEKIEGLKHIDKIIDIDQSPIGRTPRSNPSTYTGVFTEIRKLFTESPESKLRGYKAGRFSFNVKGGRCEACSGDGLKRIEMHFLPDVYVPCEVCKGRRYNAETLEVTYRGKNIADVLEMTVEEAVEFFQNIPQIKIKLAALMDVGLNYIQLGQTADTLSGGEAQRIKLATELAKRATGSTLYVLDEPTTGLHFADVEKLLTVLQRLVDSGNTVLTIEHNLDVLKAVDHIIDLGPDGGNLGGQIVAEGTPEAVMEISQSYTGKWLKKLAS
ncbi:excinuclease ABC subunit UvrA [Candidatus Gracilibacteria bacterium]|nr:excinuclease ABC subunit UvrA [Candidatus Gracilibacteria bacterium]